MRERPTLVALLMAAEIFPADLILTLLKKASGFFGIRGRFLDVPALIREAPTVNCSSDRLSR